MNPFVSWIIFIAIAGAAYYVYAKPQLPWEGKRADQIVVTKTSALLTEEKGGKVEKKKKRKATTTAKAEPATKAEKPAKSEKPPKAEKPVKSEKPVKAEKPKPQPQPAVQVVSSESDSDEAEEEDPKESIRRLHALKSGMSFDKGETTSISTPKSAKARGRQAAQQKQSLTAPVGNSRASSTGAEADIDEEESSRHISGSDPSDMLEAPLPGARVLNITPPVQPPREKKQKAAPAASVEGAHHKKNQKKKEKAKQAREEELAQLKANREQYRAIQKQEAAKEKSSSPAATPQPESVWAPSGAAAAPKATSGTAVADFLDTFNTPAPASASDREDDTTAHSSYLDQSQWEEIPSHVRDENEWATVTKKKGRSEAKQSAAVSESETPTKSESEKRARSKPVATSTMIRTKSTNGFEALSDDAGTTRSSDWAEIDGWEVHPSS